jgi:ferric enterobactin receptor
MITMIYSGLAQKKPKKANEELLPQVSVNEYFNYATLDKVLDVFRDKYKMRIEYKQEDIPADYRLSYVYSYTTARMSLEIALRDSPLDYIISSEGLIIIYDKQKQAAVKEAEAKTRYSGAATREHFTLSGIIKDQITGETLPFVNIMLKGSLKGSTSNVDGYFTL